MEAAGLSQVPATRRRGQPRRFTSLPPEANLASPQSPGASEAAPTTNYTENSSMPSHLADVNQAYARKKFAETHGLWQQEKELRRWIKEEEELLRKLDEARSQIRSLSLAMIGLGRSSEYCYERSKGTSQDWFQDGGAGFIPTTPRPV